MAKETGSTQRAARAMRQSKKNRLIAMSTVKIIDPKNSGIQCENAVSNVAQSDMMVVVRSARSFLPKKDSGSLRSFSAREILRTALS